MGGDSSGRRWLVRRLPVLLSAVVAGCVGVPTAVGTAQAHRERALASCSGGYVEADLSWGTKCLALGEFCRIGSPEYHAYGFDCPPAGRLASYPQGHPANKQAGGSPAGTPVAAKPRLGRTVLIAPRTRSSGCETGVRPNRRCSPGAFASGLTRPTICSASFRTGAIRDVPESEKYAVEAEYGLTPRPYGYTLEIDHIVPLELGGSNSIANLFPEPGSRPTTTSRIGSKTGCTISLRGSDDASGGAPWDRNQLGSAVCTGLWNPSLGLAAAIPVPTRRQDEDEETAGRVAPIPVAN